VHALGESNSLRVAQNPPFSLSYAAWSLERAQQRTGRCAQGCFLTPPQPLTHRSRACGAVNLQPRPSRRAILFQWRALFLAPSALGASVQHTKRPNHVKLGVRALRRAPGPFVSSARALVRGGRAYRVSSSMGGHA